MSAVLRAVMVSVISALVAGLLAFAPSAAAPVGRVTGTMTGPGGAEPIGVSQVRVELYRKTARGWHYRAQERLEEGETEFSFKVAKTGTYIVRAKPKAGPYTVGRSRPFRSGPGRDVSGVTVALKRSAAVAGTVVGVPTDTDRRGVVQLWRRENTTWARKRSQVVPADGQFVFGVKPGRFRVTYEHRQHAFWAPASRAVTVTGRTTSTVDLRLRESSTVSGSLARVNISSRSKVMAEVRTSRGWEEASSVLTIADTYSLPVPGARPQVRVTVLGGGRHGWHPQVFWNGSESGVLAASRATVLDLGAGSVEGVDFTLRPFREFGWPRGIRLVGTVKVGSRLRAENEWTPQPTRVRYQWYRGSDPIKGATGLTYRVRKADRRTKVWVSAELERGWYRPTAVRSKRVFVR